MLVGHAHKAKAAVPPSEPVHDQLAFGHLPAGLKERSQASLVQPLWEVPHVQVALVCCLRCRRS